MRKIGMIIVGVLLMLSFAQSSEANKKTINLDANNIKQVLKLMDSNPVLFKDPAVREKFKNLSQSIRKK